MTDISIHDQNGIKVNNLHINDSLEYVNGRVYRGSRHYYKGVGIPYYQHSIESKLFDSDFYEFIEDSGIFYLGYIVKKKAFQGKTGIFQEKYQPHFDDFIGSCGVTELEIINNSIEFERSSVEVIKSNQYDKENNQYYFVLDYKCNRKGFLEGGNVIDLNELIYYMLTENWNFIWDKFSITDISYQGYVSDVGDLFQSNTLSSKLGTVYSILYSLAYSDPIKYEQFLNLNGLKHNNHQDFIINSLAIIKMCGIDISELLQFDNTNDLYKNAVLNYLVIGKNCGDCCFAGFGEKIRQKYLQDAKKSLMVV